MHIFWGIIGITFAYFLVRYRRQIIGFTGSWGWAEKYLGTGRSETACVFFGILIFFISILSITGMLDDVLVGIFAPLVNKTGS